MKINGKSVPVGKDFRQGIIRDADGIPTLITWLKAESAKPLAISIIRLGAG
jgi:hypothetical protein